MAITAQDVSYTPTTWADGSEGGTPITASQLNRVETGVNDLATQHNALVSDVNSINDAISEWTSATLDGTYFTSGYIRYINLGGMLLVQFNDITVSQDIPSSVNNVVLASGFPNVRTDSDVMYSYGGTQEAIRVRVIGGNLVTHYANYINASSTLFYGLLALSISQD